MPPVERSRILGLNSTYGHVNDGPDPGGKKGALPLLQCQLARPIPEPERSQLQSFKLVWLATHHPVDWLCDDDQKKFLQEVKNLRCVLHTVAHQSHREKRYEKPHFTAETRTDGSCYCCARTGPLFGAHPELAANEHECGMYFLGEVVTIAERLEFKFIPRVFEKGFLSILPPHYDSPSNRQEPSLDRDGCVYLPPRTTSQRRPWRRAALTVATFLLLAFTLLGVKRSVTNRRLRDEIAVMKRAYDHRAYWAAFIRAGWIANGRVERTSRDAVTREALHGLSLVASVRARLPSTTLVADDGPLVAATFAPAAALGAPGQPRLVVGLVRARDEAVLRLRRWTIESHDGEVALRAHGPPVTLAPFTDAGRALDLRADDLGAIFLPPKRADAPLRVVVHSHCAGSASAPQRCWYGLWDVQSGRHLGSPPWSSDGPSPGRGIAAAPDGSRLMVWGERSVWINALTPGQEHRRLDHPDPVQDAVFAPQGNEVMIGFQHGHDPVSTSPDASPIAARKGPVEAYPAASAAPWLTRGHTGRDSPNALWTWQRQRDGTWAHLNRQEFHGEEILGVLNSTYTTESRVWTLVWTHQGTFLVDTLHPQREPVAVGAPATRARVSRGDETRHQLMTYANTLGELVLLDLDRAPSSPLRARFIGHSNPMAGSHGVRHIEFDRTFEEPRLLSVGEDGALRLWRTDIPTEPLTLETGAQVRSAVVSSDATRLAACLDTTPTAPASLNVWELGVNAATTPRSTTPVVCQAVALSHQEDRLAVAAENAQVQVMSFPSLRDRVLLQQNRASSYPALTFSTDDRHLLGTCYDETSSTPAYFVCRWDSTAGSRSSRWPLDSPVTSLQVVPPISQEPSRVLLGDLRHLHGFSLADYGSGPFDIPSRNASGLLLARYVQETDQLLLAHGSGQIYCQSGASLRSSFWSIPWDFEEPLCDLRGPLHQVVVGGKNGSHLLVARTDHRVQVWDARSGAELFLGDAAAPVIGSRSVVALSPDARNLVITSERTAQARRLDHALDAVNDDWRDWVCDALRRIGVPPRPEVDVVIENEVRAACDLPRVTTSDTP